jgi:p-cumic alcohol dehydrogenase
LPVQEYARYIGGLGARIVVGDLNDCAQTVDLVKTEGGTAVGTKLDVANSSSAQDMARTTLDMFGRIDALINNAALFGALKGGRFDAIPEADWDAAMAVTASKKVVECSISVTKLSATCRARKISSARGRTARTLPEILALN